jgi:hypothetical protein
MRIEMRVAFMMRLLSCGPIRNAPWLPPGALL